MQGRWGGDWPSRLTHTAVCGVVSALVSVLLPVPLAENIDGKSTSDL